MQTLITFPRRELLQKLASTALLFCVPRPQLFSFCQTPKPKFWFGDSVNFCWNNENSGEPHSETGVVVGVAWNNADREWECIVTWLSSSTHPEGNYPISDMNFVAEEILCKP